MKINSNLIEFALGISNNKIDGFIVISAGFAGVFEWMSENQSVISAWLLGVAVPVIFRLWKFVIDYKRSRELHRIALESAEEELEQTKRINEIEINKHSK